MKQVFSVVSPEYGLVLATLDSLENLKKFLLEWIEKDKERYEAFDWSIEVREIVSDYQTFKKDGYEHRGSTYMEIEGILG